MAVRSSTGQGAASRPTVDATRQGKYPNDNRGGQRSQGEIAGAGSIYAAALNERPNISNQRNQGPVRSHSRIGKSTIPVAMQSSRNTGRVRG